MVKRVRASGFLSGALKRGGVATLGMVGAVLCFVFAAPVPGIALSDRFDGRSFSCSFRDGQTMTYRDDRFRKDGSEQISFVISELNYKSQSAKVVAGRGVSQARIVQALDATHFIELTVGGYMNITTVFDTRDSTGAQPAVHSRHLGIVGQPLVSQFTGSCRAAIG